MKFTEIENKTYFGQTDDKARRVLNTSQRIANITAKEIENGVSLEKLESINVPVYRYQTQITIHGVLPDIANSSILGYKTLFQNKNGSIGVKYIAIDAEKKALLKRVDWALDTEQRKLGFSSNSSGIMLYRAFMDKEKAISTLNEIPNCFVGCKYNAKSMFGEYYTVIEFDAIPECNLWPFISWYSCGNINNIQDLESVENKNIREHQEAVKKIEQERQKEKDELNNVLQPLKDDLLAKGYKWYEGEKFEGIFINPAASSDRTKTGYIFIEYRKHGKKFKYRRTEGTDINNPVFSDNWKMPNKYHVSNCKGFIK